MIIHLEPKWRGKLSYIRTYEVVRFVLGTKREDLSYAINLVFLVSNLRVTRTHHNEICTTTHQKHALVVVVDTFFSQQRHRESENV